MIGHLYVAVLVAGAAILLWYQSPWWAYVVLVLVHMMLLNCFWWTVERVFPFVYERQTVEDLGEHLDEYWRRGRRLAQLIITDEYTAKTLRIRKWWSWFGYEHHSPVFLAFICDALKHEDVDPKDLQKRWRWPLWVSIPAETPSADETALGTDLWSAYRGGLKQRWDAGKVACTLPIGAGIVYKPEATKKPKELLRFILQELYELPETARCSVQIKGGIMWQHDVQVGIHTRGVKFPPWRGAKGKPYRWFAAGPNKWGWIRKLFNRNDT